MLISTHLGIFASTAALVTGQNTGVAGSSSSSSSSIQPTTVTPPTAATGSLTVTAPIQTGCPTVTTTGIQCSTCVVPACLQISTVTQSCGCPTPVPTQTVNWPCQGGCGGLSCATSYVVVAQSALGCPLNGSIPLLQPPTQLLPSSGGLSSTTTPDGQVPSNSSDVAPGPTAAGARIMPFKFWL
ncbi:hypothetical protein PpBr36_00076 [Pyricularia pennisetigena]|uniref:hypothetical protein n=1 Tax=Pyricularia pennisetigena TaxID=1578925 RepID=UPI00114D5278|nr:hypothetical protein PpBr36_00076 [Pyricularia pennisetigena]TLS28080.1 hypothetical protein PpBr36_00076 [Pyricularia pennisetigena]